jgi:hypothetical protein
MEGIALESFSRLRGGKFRPGDAQDFLKWGIVGFVGFGAYQMASKLARRTADPMSVLVDPVESIGNDPVILEALVKIQSYRELNPWMFSMAVRNIDHLLFLENALVSKEVQPVRNDKALAFTYFRIALTRLNTFQHLIKHKLSNKHAMAVNIYTEKIYDQLKKHFLNVLHLCSVIRPENLLKRAEEDVEAAMKRFRHSDGHDSVAQETWKRLTAPKSPQQAQELEDDDIRPEESISRRAATFATHSTNFGPSL